MMRDGGNAPEVRDRLEACADALSEEAFSLLATFIHEHCGIKITFEKKGMLEGRLRRRVRALGLETLNRYCQFLFQEGGIDHEIIPLIDVVTTNKTDFFREPHHFQYLLDTILPGHWVGRRSSAPIKIWSAGCSSGAEPYTIAMVCALFAEQNPGFSAEILATDICTEVLVEASRAVYPHAMIEPVPMELRRRYLLRSRDRRADTVRMARSLRGMVRFGRLNLMEKTYPIRHKMDVIFCRNLLIYFDRPTQQAVLTKLCGHLRVGGHLILGHSESIVGYDLPVRPVGTTIFQREEATWEKSGS